MPRNRSDNLSPLLALVAVGLFAACGGPSAEEDARVCADVECSAGRCVAENSAPVCRCSAWEQAAGLTCAIVGYRQSDDHGDTPETATALAPSVEFQEGIINPPFRAKADRDVFAMPTAAGHGYRIVVRAGTLAPVDVRLVEASGREVRTRAVTTSEGTRVEFVSTEEAPRFITVAAAEGSGASGTYAYRLEDLGRDAHGDTLATATPLALTNTPFPLAIEFQDDADVFTFRTEPNQGFRFSCERENVSVHLMDGEGAAVNGGVTRNSSRVSAGQLSPVASTWFVRVYSSFDATLATQCQLDDLGRDDHANAIQGATPLAAGIPVAVRLHGPNDVDVFSFFATAGHIYDIRFHPAVYERRFRLTDADGKTLAETQWNRIVHEAASTGTYYVHLLPNSSWGSDIEVRVDDLGTDDHGATPQTATLAAVGETVTGLIHKETDLDAISVPLDPDVFYRLSCTRECTLTTRTSGARLYMLKIEEGMWHVHTSASGLVTFIVSSSFNPPYDFTFKLDQASTDDHGDDAEHATPQAVPVNAAGVFELGSDVDVLSFELEASRTYVASGDRTTIRILDPLGAQVALAYEWETGDHTFTAPSSGTYVAELESQRPYLQREVAWSFSLREQ
ncbi:hypothetical protein ACN6A1_20700 [Myxococcus virescens]|uniref:hypothetical protein n=1 Tax=Myxococcus virescens TaxID=83456 RepID=UPI003DA67E30